MSSAHGYHTELEMVVMGRSLCTVLMVVPERSSAASILAFAWPEPENWGLELVGSSGRLRRVETINAVAGQNAMPLRLAGHDLVTGVYFARLRGRNGNATVRVMIAGR